MPSEHTWRRVVEQAWKGDARHLLELLVDPYQTNGAGEAVPGAFYQLPDDQYLRAQIVEVLMFGPWRKTEVDNLFEARTRIFKEGKPARKPALCEYEVAWAAFRMDLYRVRAIESKPDIDAMAESLGVKPETLRRRISRYLKRRQSDKP